MKIRLLPEAERDLEIGAGRCAAPHRCLACFANGQAGAAERFSTTFPPPVCVGANRECIAKMRKCEMMRTIGPISLSPGSCFGYS